jgi:maleylpyruvate isomerase
VTSALDAATERLLDTADHLPDEDWAAPSVCTGWSRAHVLAHLALNAEGLAGVVRGHLDGHPATMYRSNEARDGDIADLATAPPAEIRTRLLTASTTLADALGELGTPPEDAEFERTPGGVVMRVAAVPWLRLREVEIHHADLDAGYSHADWPAETAVAFLDGDARRYGGPPLLARATDLGREWSFGSPGPADPVVSGPASALAWWATGRPVPDGPDVLSSTTGTVPTMEGR